HDPAPRRMLLPRYPRLVAWAGDEAPGHEREAEGDGWDGEGSLAPLPESTPFARVVLGEMAATYAPFARANARACADTHKAFVIPMYGEDVSYLARGYVERSRRMVQQRLQALAGEDRAQADALLSAYGLADVFA
ncbi:MAG: hypothetical protein AAF447_21310, partial [Myxococcota bacterium]